MIAIWTWLNAWWRRQQAAHSFDALIETTAEQCVVIVTRGTVAQVQAAMRAAVAEDRLAAYTDAWLQGSVEELSADLLQERREQRRAGAPGPTGSSGTAASSGC